MRHQPDPGDWLLVMLRCCYCCLQLCPIFTSRQEEGYDEIQQELRLQHQPDADQAAMLLLLLAAVPCNRKHTT